ncbi:hypothetical protein [endosymbiont GvMRE of Glomus versiforme]|uniref:hypothetical protein n=1 Tax=endosymbiont GvMRE of Glomus versiforme TaxID=2039283 RepID=UPI000EEE105E|nr:hypothetical protein [endosymbiont GvMRE of Glomus versiforme]RHZ35583.1 hypothetical protein GvMRE_IIg273 [endosymbiont GvMRE of Glomus versiforme]
MQKQRQIQIQKQAQLTAHQKKLVLENFHYAIESLEEYIEKIGLPGFRKQIFDQSINSPDRSPADLADDFLAQLLCFKAIVNNKPEFFREEIKREFYKWINATGINVNNCPKELKHYLFEINEILEGRGEKIVEQTREIIDGEVDPRDVIKVFAALQVPLNNNREKGEALKGKTYRDIEVESRFDGDSRQGDISFNQISWDLNHDEFDFFPQVIEKKRKKAADDFAEWELEEEEEIREQEEIKERERKEKLASEAREQAEKEKKQAEQRAKEKQQKQEAKEKLVVDRVQAIRKVQTHWDKNQDKWQKIDGQSINQVLDNDWRNKIETAQNEVHIGVCVHSFIEKVDNAKLDMDNEIKRRQEQQKKELKEKFKDVIGKFIERSSEEEKLNDMKSLVELVSGDKRVIKEAFNELAEQQSLTSFCYDDDVNIQQNIQQIQRLKIEKLQFENAASSDVSSKDDFPIIWTARILGAGILSIFVYWIIKWKMKRK